MTVPEERNLVAQNKKKIGDFDAPPYTLFQLAAVF